MDADIGEIRPASWNDICHDGLLGSCSMSLRSFFKFWAACRGPEGAPSGNGPRQSTARRVRSLLPWSARSCARASAAAMGVVGRSSPQHRTISQSL